MEVKTGLLIVWILMMIQGMTCRPACIVTQRIDYTKWKMEGLLKEFLSANGNETTKWWKPISELNLTNLSSEEKKQKAQCGLNFMQIALELINQHQSGLHDRPKLIFDQLNITNRQLEYTKHSVKHAMGECTNMTEPDFQNTGIYDRKQWGRSVLETSIDFLDELVKIVNCKKHA